MILGTSNFNNQYNKLIIEKKECFKLIEYFESNNGFAIDTAYNYKSYDILKEYDFKGKIITKIWHLSELEKTFNELNTDKIYCMIVRDSGNKELLEKVRSYQKRGFIEKVGISIYYPHELIQNCNSVHIPADRKFLDYLKIMTLHSEIYIRSLYNYIPHKDIEIAKECFQEFKYYERLDLNHRIEAVIGVNNLEQLKENMEIFK